jgi:hypothetical protein
MSDTNDLVVRITERRQQLDQDYYNDLSALRQPHGDQAVDQALAMVQQQRDQVAVRKADWRRGKHGAFTGNYRGVASSKR